MMNRVLLTLFTLCVSAHAFANITLSQNRIYFGPNDRANAVQLRNTGGSAMEYKTSIHFVKMTEQGQIIKVAAPQESKDELAAKMLRFSPKRGVVPAGGKQVIRFSLRRPRDLEVGEYRAVLSIATSIATEKPEDVTLKPTLAYNMPVIMRHGETKASTELQNTRLVMLDQHPHIELTQTLNGNRSLYGNYTVLNKRGDVMGLLNGVAVYTPLSQRKVLIPLNEAPSGDLIVKYQEVSSFGGREEAEASITL
jgi:P pilus assembly chaperone PapD